MDTTEPAEQRARVFISCGQAKGTDEERIAAEIARRLEELGFYPNSLTHLIQLRWQRCFLFLHLGAPKQRSWCHSPARI
jgi:hypothetical protein